MQCCRRDPLLMPPPARKMTNPVVERRSDQLASARACGECFEYRMPRCLVRTRYTSTRTMHM
eukprot:3822735-Prymnesium_polylepis.1